MNTHDYQGRQLLGNFGAPPSIARLIPHAAEAKSTILNGEICGCGEQDAAQFAIDDARKDRKKPIASIIAGQSESSGSRMGHAGAIVFGDSPAGLGEAVLKAIG